MTKLYVPSASVALGLAMLLLVPFDVAAKSGGGGLGVHHGGFHSRHTGGFRSHRHGGFRHRPLLGGYVTTAPYYGPPYIGDAPIQTFVAPPEPPHALSCSRGQATVTVPSADGRTREIKITRC
jgi:hypothetical protein